MNKTQRTGIINCYLVICITNMTKIFETIHYAIKLAILIASIC